jgi:hypothetical protein
MPTARANLVGLSPDEQLAQARALRAKNTERQKRALAEFETFRPTPTPEENNLTAVTGMPEMA